MPYTMDSFRKAIKSKIGGGSDAVTEKPATDNYPEKLTTGYYRVRKTWSDKKSQIGAYCILSNAKTQANKNPGCYVFDDSGKSIYPTSANSAYREYTVVKGDSLTAVSAQTARRSWRV